MIEYYCFDCGTKKTETIEPLGHSIITEKAIPATCEETGLTAKSYCTRCGTVFSAQEVIPEIGHIWADGAVIKEATCTENGIIVFSCTNEGCDKTREEPIYSKGHSITIDDKVSSTCEKDGLTEGSHCSVCGMIIIEQETICSIGHNWDNGVVIKEPTCKETGVKRYTCLSCDSTFEEEIEKEDHIIEYISELPASCTVDGLTEGSRCSVCGEIIIHQTVITPAFGHSWEDAEITKEATCQTEGRKVVKCSVCGEEKEEVIARLAHRIVIDPAVEATTTSTGLTAGTHCSVCGEVINAQQIIPKLAESVDTPDSNKDPYGSNVTPSI